MTNLDDAEKRIAKAKLKAEELGVPMSVAVVDQSGVLIALERMDGAGPLTPEIAYGKAYTAVCFGLGKGGYKKTSSYMGEVFKREGLQFFNSINQLANGKIVPTPGGEPVVVNGRIVMGIGVSGGKAGEDELCAQAGASM